MTKINYLPIKESLGYKNVRQALMTIFSVDLDDQEIQRGEDENFNFLFRYKDYEMTIGISSTRKHVQLEAGEGGLFNIWFSHYSGERFTVTFLYKILENEALRRIFKFYL